MNKDLEPKDLEPVESVTAVDPSAPPVAAAPRRRIRVAALFNTSALLATTALITVIEPKAPPFKGD